MSPRKLHPNFKKVQLTLKLTEMYKLVLDALRGRLDFDRGRPDRDFDSHVVPGLLEWSVRKRRARRSQRRK